MARIILAFDGDKYSCTARRDIVVARQFRFVHREDKNVALVQNAGPSLNAHADMGLKRRGSAEADYCVCVRMSRRVEHPWTRTEEQAGHGVAMTIPVVYMATGSERGPDYQR